MTLVTARHNAVVDLVVEALDFEMPYYEIKTDEQSDFSTTSITIDLQVKNTGGRTLWLIDIKTPYDETENLKSARELNETKYESLEAEAKAKFPAWSIVGTIVVGCLGS